MSEHGHDHGHGHGHGHAVSADADRRYLRGALALIAGFMAVEVVVGVIAGSLALISDAGHMLTDAMAIVLALVAMRIAARPPRGGFTYGLKRAEIISAQVNGITLLLLAAYFTFEGVRRLIVPPEVEGLFVVVTGLAGIAVNVAATWLLSKANRSSLNVEGAFQHILNDLYAFIATTLAGLVVWLTGWYRADAIAALVVAALMLKAGWGLVRDAGRVFMEAAPARLDPAEVGRQIAAIDTVVEVHDLHIWEVTSGYPALSAHVLVVPGADCHAARLAVERLLRERHDIEHTTLQVDHAMPGGHAFDEDGGLRRLTPHCPDPHGPTHHAPRPDAATVAATAAAPAAAPVRAAADEPAANWAATCHDGDQGA
ncbi:cation diffusion facilitator family transporter [Nonomuraea sp. NPDC001699]